MTTDHQHKQTKAVINRLSRIEGHVRSVKQMVEDGRDCADILMQLAAVRSALNKVGRVVLEDHLENCLLNTDCEADRDKSWAEVKEALDLFL